LAAVKAAAVGGGALFRFLGRMKPKVNGTWAVATSPVSSLKGRPNTVAPLNLTRTSPARTPSVAAYAGEPVRAGCNNSTMHSPSSFFTVTPRGRCEKTAWYAGS
jgi:hypothetical protein